MARYVVMQQGADVTGAKFIRDMFSVPALVFPHVWLLFHRQWLAAIAVIGAMVICTLAGWYFDARLLAFGGDILISLYVALEGASLRIANLEQAGWSQAAIIEAASPEEAETRYFGAAVMPETLPDLNFRKAINPALGISIAATNAFAFPARG